MSFVTLFSRFFFLVLRFTSGNDDFVEKGHDISIIFLAILFLVVEDDFFMKISLSFDIYVVWTLWTKIKFVTNIRNNINIKFCKGLNL